MRATIPFLTTLVLAALLATPSVVGEDTGLLVRPPSAGGDPGSLAIVIGGPGTDTAALLAAGAVLYPEDAVAVAPPVRPAGATDTEPLLPPEAHDPDARRDAPAASRVLVDAGIREARRRFPGLRVSFVLAAYEGAETALRLVRAGRLSPRQVVLIDPDPLRIPEAPTKSADPLAAPRRMNIDVYLATGTTEARAGTATAIRERLDAWPAPVRVFESDLRGRALAEIAEQIAWTQRRDRYAAVEGEQGVEITLNALVERVSKADVVFVGEDHDNFTFHRFERDLLAALVLRDPKMAVSFEMFERDVQDVLDRYVAGEIEEKEFLAGSRPWPNYRTDYRPLVEMCREKGLPAIAGNIPRGLARRISRGGIEAMDAFDEDERRWSAREIVVPDDAYRDRFFATMSGMMGGHGGGAEDRIAKIYAAQCIKDDTMAESIADFLDAHPDTARVVHYNGSFHSNYGLGTAAKLRDLKPDLEILTIACVATENPRAIDLSEVDAAGTILVYVPRSLPRPRRTMPSPGSMRTRKPTIRRSPKALPEEKPEEVETPEETPEEVPPETPTEKPEERPEEAPSVPATPEKTTGVVVLQHDLSVTFDPAAHRLEATDTLTVPPALVVRKSVMGSDRFLVYWTLNDALEVKSVEAVETGPLTFKGNLKRMSGPGFVVMFEGTEAPTEPIVLKFAYSGTIDEPIQPGGSPVDGGHDSTEGVIREEGIFLSGGSGWYPSLDGSDLARFDLSTSIPEPYFVISQGRRTRSEVVDGSSLCRYEAEMSTPGLSVVAGRFAMTTGTTEGGVVVTVFLSAANERWLSLFLARTIGYIETYVEILGPYPHSKFDLVENFFSTGYGFPSFTLLGNMLLRMGPGALRPGMVDHEVVHGWWGCGVFVDRATGNWCEALTSYCTNYYARERQDPADAARHRQKTLQSYNLSVPVEKEVSLRSFVWGSDPIARAVGYEKGWRFFHLVRRLVGDEPFWGVLRDLASGERGRRISWATIQAAFRSAAPDAAILDTVFGQWLDGTERPDLTVERVENARSGRWRFVVRQHTVEPFVLPVTVTIRKGDEVEHRDLLIREGETVVETDPPAKGVAWSVEVDPEAHVLRRLAEDEITPCLGATLADEKVAVVLPGPDASADLEAYRAVAASLGDRAGLVVLEGGRVDEEILATHSLIVLGTPAENRLLARLAETRLADGALALGAPTRYRDEAGETRDLPDGADLLATVPSPFAPGRFVTMYVPGSDVGVKRTRLIFRYRWDTQVVFVNGRASEKILRPTARNRCRAHAEGQTE